MMSQKIIICRQPFRVMIAALVQPAPLPGQKQAEDALSTLASQGILGAICVLLAIALYVSIKGWLKTKDDRLADQKEMATVLKSSNEAAAKLAIESNRSVDGAKSSVEALMKRHEDLKDWFDHVGDRLDDVKTAVDQVSASQREVGVKVADLEKEQVIFVATVNAWKPKKVP